MPRVSFTYPLQRHVSLPPIEVGSGTVRVALASVFAAHARARGYVLDDQGAVRQHMIVFVDGEPVRDRKRPSDVVPPDGEIYVMQASGG